MRVFSAVLLCVLLTLRGRADTAVSTWNYIIGTVAGNDWVGDEGPATSAILFQADGLCADKKGDLYIADSGDNRVRKVTPDGKIHTAAGTGIRGFSGDKGPANAALLNSPYGLACDASGNLYIADLGNGRVREVTPDGVIHTIAGGGGAPGVLSAPRDLALDGSGNLYISDFSGQRIYELAGGSLLPIAGTGVAGIAGDGGAAVRAQLSYPAGLAFDAQGTLYVADSGNHLIRKILRGVITSVARAATPTGLALDPQGALYVADPSAGQVLKISPGGAPDALLNASVRALAFGADGSLYASENTAVLKVATSGLAAAFAGGGNAAHGDGGPAIAARLNHPSGVAIDADGNLYIADRDNNRIRRVTPNGTITTVAADGLSALSSVSADAAGNLYIADTGNQRVVERAANGKVVTVASRGLLAPVYALPDGAGNVYIADADAGRIVKAAPDGTLTVVISGLNAPRGLALDHEGTLYFTEAGAASVSRLTAEGTLTRLGVGAWKLPEGVVVDSSGDVFVADGGLEQVVAVDPKGRVAAIAGTGVSGFSGDGSAGLDARLGMPFDLALLPGGSLVVADLDNNRVRLLAPVAAAPVTSGPAPIVLPSVVNAASLTPGPVAPGMLLLIENLGIGTADLASTQVLFGDASASVLSADPSGGMLVVAPLSIAGQSSVTIVIAENATTVASIPVAVADSAVALFTNAPGHAAANNQDGSVNSQANPAARGSVISLYGTGLGISGEAATATLGGFPAAVLYSGPVAQYPGLFQINVTIPSGYLAPGDLSVTVTEGSSSSQVGVAIWVN